MASAAGPRGAPAESSSRLPPSHASRSRVAADSVSRKVMQELHALHVRAERDRETMARLREQVKALRVANEEKDKALASMELLSETLAADKDVAVRRAETSEAVVRKLQSRGAVLASLATKNADGPKYHTLESAVVDLKKQLADVKTGLAVAERAKRDLEARNRLLEDALGLGRDVGAEVTGGSDPWWLAQGAQATEGPEAVEQLRAAQARVLVAVAESREQGVLMALRVDELQKALYATEDTAQAATARARHAEEARDSAESRLAIARKETEAMHRTLQEVEERERALEAEVRRHEVRRVALQSDLERARSDIEEERARRRAEIESAANVLRDEVEATWQQRVQASVVQLERERAAAGEAERAASERVRTATAENAALRADLQAARAELADVRAELEEVKERESSAARRDEELLAARRERDAAVVAREDAEARAAGLDEEVDNLHAQLDHMIAAQAGGRRATALEAEAATLPPQPARVRELLGTVEELQGELDAVRQARQRVEADLRGQLNRAVEAQAALGSEVAGLRARISRVDSEARAARTEAMSLADQLERARAEIAELRQTKAILQQSLARTRRPVTSAAASPAKRERERRGSVGPPEQAATQSQGFAISLSELAAGANIESDDEAQEAGGAPAEPGRTGGARPAEGVGAVDDDELSSPQRRAQNAAAWVESLLGEEHGGQDVVSRGRGVHAGFGAAAVEGEFGFDNEDYPQEEE
ncbi:unnamed protein product [Pedinophyceae sp. YPF-701]|nr:unnamed protein product [Pedinophyceae sp. YPF-701]